MVGGLFIVFTFGHPHTAGAGFLLAAIPFLFIFVSGVLADLLETEYRAIVLACVVMLLIIYAGGTLFALAKASQS
jgi:hypothetical protein